MTMTKRVVIAKLQPSQTLAEESAKERSLFCWLQLFICCVTNYLA